MKLTFATLAISAFSFALTAGEIPAPQGPQPPITPPPAKCMTPVADPGPRVGCPVIKKTASPVPAQS